MRRTRRKLSERGKLLLLSLLVGLGSGFAAVLLEKGITLIQSYVFPVINKGGFSWVAVVLPALGMLLSLLITRYAVRDNISHGVTKVLVAVSRNESRIRPHNIWSSLVTSALTIGLGGSVGAEAPIVYTGAAIGSNIGRKFKLSYRGITVLLGCGAAGAIAGIFKAPLAGILFTLEILLFNMSIANMMPLLMSVLTATVVSYLFTGPVTPFACTLAPFDFAKMPFYLVLGAFCGLCSLYFTRTTLRLEDRFARIRSPWVRWAVGAAGVGLCILFFPPLFGEGYNFLGALLNGESWNFDGESPLAFMLGSAWGIPLFVLLVMLFKVVSMTLTNSGGGVGGTFGPTLFVGALAGFVVSRSLSLAGFPLPEQNFVLVGMAGLMAGVMQAPMTAIFLIAEITGGYELLIPLIVAASISYGTIRFFERYSIYTKRIAAQGELLTHDSDQAVLTLLKTSDLVEHDFTTVRCTDSLGTLVEAISRSRRNLFPVLDEQDRFQGVVTLDDVRQLMFDRALYDQVKMYNIMKSAPAFVYLDEKMESVMEKFETTQAWNLPVLDDENKYLGFVSKSKIFSSYRDQLKAVSDE